MTKYTEQFKLSVIEDYLSGTRSYQEVAKAYGLDRSMVRRWIATYKIHGVASLQKKYRHYSVKFKLGALKHMQEHSLSHRETAAHFDICSIGILRAWEHQYDAGGIAALLPRPKGRPKQMDQSTNTPPTLGNHEERTREELLEELNYLRMENAYLKKLRALIQANQQATLRKKRK